MEQFANAGSYRVLARAYRPTKLSELIGQDALVRTLTNGIRSGRLAHAYLLSGIRGIGKTTTARIIARALNCIGPDGVGEPTPEPCGLCPSCRSIAEDRAVDVIEMDAASHTGKGDVLELMDGVHYAPAAGRYKIYIFDEVHMLSEKAWNALLKTIEEPPPHVKFIFATTEVRKVPVTVISRCQRFELRRVPSQVLIEHLARIAEKEAVDVSDDALALIAQAGEGSVRDALSLLDQAIALSAGPVEAVLIQEMLGLGERGRLIDLYAAAADGNAKDAITIFEALFALGTDPIAIVHDLLELSHVLSRTQIGIETTSSFTASDALRRRCEALSTAQSAATLARAWQMMLQGLEEVRNAPDARDATEMLLLRLASVHDLPPPGELARMLLRGEVAVRDKLPAASATQPTTPRDREPVAKVSHAEPLSELPQTLREIVTLLRERGDRVLAAQLYQYAHLLRLEPRRLELRLSESLPKDFANKLSTALTNVMGERWVVALANDEGDPTLAEQDAVQHAADMERARADPKLQGLLEVFPGASLIDVRVDRSGSR